MKRVQVFMLSVCPIALMTTVSFGNTTRLPAGALDSEEKYAEFWSDVVGTEYESGSCALSLGAISPIDSTYFISAVDDRMDESEPFRVGEFTIRDQSVAHVFEPVTYSHDDGRVVNVLVNHMTLIRVEGIAEFDGFRRTHLNAHLFISNTENMTTGEVTQELQRAFVPNFVGKNARSRSDGRLLTPVLESSMNQNDSSEGNLVEPCDRFFTLCRNEDGFCADVAACLQDHWETIRHIRESRMTCTTFANEDFNECIMRCNDLAEIDPCESDCHAQLIRERKSCDSRYLKQMTEAKIALSSCVKSAEANNSDIHPGCDCPADMVPFPNQRSPKWEDAPCQEHDDTIDFPEHWPMIVY